MISAGVGDLDGMDARASAQRRGRIALLDAGGSKISFAIAELADAAEPEQSPSNAEISVLAATDVDSAGYARGEIYDMRGFVRACQAAIREVEAKAGRGPVDEVVVSIDGQSMQSHYGRGSASLSNGAVTDRDLCRAMRSCAKPKLPTGHSILHAIPVHWSVDDREGLSDPRGLTGDRLEVDVVWMSVRNTILQELSECARRCGLKPAAFVAKPYASGLGCLDPGQDEQADLACIDFGATSTGVAVFIKGICIFVQSIPYGGYDLTEKIAKSLDCSLEEAEYLKQEIGTGRHNPAVEHIVEQEMRTLIFQIRDALHASEFSGIPGRRVRLVGGGCRIPIVQDLAGILAQFIEYGRPCGVWWPAEKGGDPEYVTLVGLAQFVHTGAPEMEDFERAMRNPVSGVLQKTFHWMATSW